MWARVVAEKAREGSFLAIKTRKWTEIIAGLIELSYRIVIYMYCPKF